MGRMVDQALAENATPPPKVRIKFCNKNKIRVTTDVKGKMYEYWRMY